MIVIEGLDGAGKSFLAKRLSKDLGIPLFHHGKPAENIVEFRRKCMRSAILFHHPIIQDRTPFISEAIYGHYRDYDPFIMRETAEFTIRVNPIILLYCRPEKYSHQTKSYDSQEYLDWLKTNWVELQSDYDCLMVRLHAIKYDWSNKKLEPIAYDGIIELCRKKLNQLIFNQIPNNSDS